jgi:hypothetical protein
MAVLKIFSSTYTAEPAIPAMVWFLIISHPQIANVTMILPKLDTTVHTIVTARKFLKKKKGKKNKVSFDDEEKL